MSKKNKNKMNDEPETVTNGNGTSKKRVKKFPTVSPNKVDETDIYLFDFGVVIHSTYLCRRTVKASENKNGDQFFPLKEPAIYTSLEKYKNRGDKIHVHILNGDCYNMLIDILPDEVIDMYEKTFDDICELFPGVSGSKIDFSDMLELLDNLSDTLKEHIFSSDN